MGMLAKQDLIRVNLATYEISLPLQPTMFFGILAMSS
jgi:hypothetical protein